MADSGRGRCLALDYQSFSVTLPRSVRPGSGSLCDSFTVFVRVPTAELGLSYCVMNYRFPWRTGHTFDVEFWCRLLKKHDRTLKPLKLNLTTSEHYVGEGPAAKNQNGNSRGINSTLTTITISVNGTPTFTKSKNRYPPGAHTSVFTGEDTGVINAADAATATAIVNG